MLDVGQQARLNKRANREPGGMNNAYHRELTRQIWVGIHRYMVGDVYETWLRLSKRMKQVKEMEQLIEMLKRCSGLNRDADQASQASPLDVSQHTTEAARAWQGQHKASLATCGELLDTSLWDHDL